MSFFKRHPKLWLTVWVIFGLGNLLIAFNAIFDHGFDTAPFVKALIGLTLAGMMSAYLIPEIRTNNAQH
ncbi:hypothetical protein [Sphingomonas sp. PR090111-T3T-6A]|uniref:hypothetical protein n=1 Tax=Sphingomonas sp. PR090111-T3T-6A TaxID=685778 RepID=UPI00038148E4|nr:hypothetical protein [Sphingomonas sp. PR090111-T3T-6A]